MLPLCQGAGDGFWFLRQLQWLLGTQQAMGREQGAGKGRFCGG